MKIKRYKNSQKFRVMMSANAHPQVCFSVFVRADEIRSGIGGDYWTNAALQKALEALEYSRSGNAAAARAAMGISGIWEARNIQLDVINPRQGY